MKASEKQVDAAAKALREHDMEGHITMSWEKLPSGVKRKWRVKATIVLLAAEQADILPPPRDLQRVCPTTGRWIPREVES